MPWRTRRDAGGEIVLQEVDYNGRPSRAYSEELSMEAVREATSQALAQAVRDLDPGIRVIGTINVNVNIQLASGGGASNHVGPHIGGH